MTPKTVLVTGGSQGIGRGIALEFAKTGYQVAINYHKNFEAAEEVKDIITRKGGICKCFAADVGNESEVSAMFEAIQKQIGDIQVLINNAGILKSGAIENLSLEDWNQVINTNVTGVFLCCKTLANRWIRQKKAGQIINIASISGTIPEANTGAYTPSKAGVLGLTKLLAIEWAQYGIQVNAISPGPILTPLQKTAYATDALLAARNEAVPMKRHGTPREIGKVAVFLASEGAAFITGEEIKVDGGSQVSMFNLVRQLSSQG